MLNTTTCPGCKSEFDYSLEDASQQHVVCPRCNQNVIPLGFETRPPIEPLWTDQPAKLTWAAAIGALTFVLVAFPEMTVSAAAARQNGKLGGRPRKVPAPPPQLPGSPAANA